MAGTGAQDGAGGRIFRHQHQHGWGHGLGLQGVQHNLGHQTLGHTGGGGRGQGVDADVVLGAFQGQGLHETHQGQFGRAVVGLAEITVQAGAGRGHQNAAVFLLDHVRPHGLGAVHGAHQVHVQHQAEIRQVHLGKGLVAQDACIVDQNVDTAPGVDGLLHHGLHSLIVGHRGAIGQGLAASGTNLVHHGLGRTHRTAAAVHLAAQIVDQHLGAARGQQQGMFATQSAAGTGHNGYTTLEIQTHTFIPAKLG